MRLSVLAISALALTPVFGQTPQFTADKLTKTGAVTRGTGHVKAVVGAVIITADEGTFNSDTEGIELTGRVDLSLPERGDHYVIRYGTGTYITKEPVGLFAEKLTLKNGLLIASGRVVITPNDEKFPQAWLSGDDFTLFLRNGDSTLKGNVRVSNMTKSGQPRLAPPYGTFPADIIKK